MQVYSNVERMILQFRGMSDDEADRLRKAVVELFDGDDDPLVHIPLEEEDDDGWRADVIVEGGVAISAAQRVMDELTEYVGAR